METELLAWLGPREASRYRVLRKTGPLVERDDRIVLASADQR